MQDFYSEDDLKDVLSELNDESEGDKAEEEDEEMQASQRRYEEIIKKYKN
jgi:hypothetical protein